MSAPSYSAYYHHDVFEMEDTEQPFEMEDDYGFYEDLDSDDETVAPVPILSDEESSLSLSVPVCSSRIEDEDPDSLVTSPPLLTPFMVDTIAEEGLPWSMQDTQWERLFASTRDGTCFSTFMRRVRGHGHTVIVAKTSDGKIIGGYATDVWSGRKKSASGDAASHAFLFVVEPPIAGKTKRAVAPMGHTFIPRLEELGTSPASTFDFDFHQLSISSPKQRDDEPRVVISKCSTKDSANAGWKQACQMGNKFISLSDGNGDLTLAIENSFSHGVVAHSGEDREEFTIEAFEVYGFSED